MLQPQIFRYGSVYHDLHKGSYDSQMALKHIEIEGFKSIRELKLDLRPLNILIGSNGSGKSNFISLFKLLNQAVEQQFQLSVRQAGGADALLYYGRKNTGQIRVLLMFEQNGYECVWIPTNDDALIFKEETGYFQGSGYARPYSDGYPVTLQESVLPRMANEGGRFPKNVLDALTSWKVYHFHDTSDSAAVKATRDINDNLYFRSNAENLAPFLFGLQKMYPESYDSIRDTVRMVAPFFDDFILRPIPENQTKIRLEWKERGSDYPFLAHHLSDGTLRFICLATLLMQPRVPSTILIDEPELGLHPYAITVLASLMQSAAARTQVIATTQSISLLNEFSPEDLIVVNRKDNQSTFDLVDQESLTEWLKAYSLGDLWEKNVLGGRPSR
jgi:predicted ATPase